MAVFAAGALVTLAKGALTSVIAPFVDEATEAALNAARDTIRGVVAGRMTIEEWANVVIQGVDKVKDRAVDEGNLRFIGGKLKFGMSENGLEYIAVSFQLYFQDEFEKWHKAEAKSDIPTSKFTLEALGEFKSKGEILFEVE